MYRAPDGLIPQPGRASCCATLHREERQETPKLSCGVPLGVLRQNTAWYALLTSKQHFLWELVLLMVASDSSYALDKVIM